HPDTSAINDLYLDRLRGTVKTSDSIAQNDFRLYRIPLRGTTATYEVISNYGIELPAIHYQRYNTYDYGVAYGVSTDRQHPDAVVNILARVDIHTGTTTLWSEESCYPGEPIFVEAPDAQREDDGVILSVVLNALKGNSFLLVLDAHTFEEIGRAEVPHHIPLGFHGIFFPEVV
ncbi:MAG TPA: carotenoid oxygenase family protein, partial [Ktedonobacteraceae bacterium]